MTLCPYREPAGGSQKKERAAKSKKRKTKKSFARFIQGLLAKKKTHHSRNTPSKPLLAPQNRKFVVIAIPDSKTAL